MGFGVAGQPGADSTGNQTGEQTDGNGLTTQEKIDESKDNKVEEGATYAGNEPNPSVKDLGIDVDKVQDTQPIQNIFAQVAAADALARAPADDGVTVYSSHPIQNFSIGVYSFVNTVLKLKNDQVEAFETLLEGLPPQDRLHIRKIDTAAANQIVQDRMDANTQATRAFDSSVGRSAMAAMQAANPSIGTKPLEDLNAPAVGLAEGTGNAPVIIETQQDGDGTEPQG